MPTWYASTPISARSEPFQGVPISARDTRPVELRQLRHFVALAEEASFTKAADRELIVQSGLSSSIRTLERDVGSELFIRGSRPVRLTSAGRALLPAARRILQEADRGLRIVRDVSGLVSGPFSIGMIQIHAPFESCELVGWMATFAQEHAGLDISVRQLDRERTLALVAAGEMDCAVVHGAPASYPGLRIRRLASVPLALLAPLNPGAALASSNAAALSSPNEAAVNSSYAAGLSPPTEAASSNATTLSPTNEAASSNGAVPSSPNAAPLHPSNATALHSPSSTAPPSLDATALASPATAPASSSQFRYFR